MTIRKVLVALCAIGLGGQTQFAQANDSAELEQLRALVQRLESKVQTLEQRSDQVEAKQQADIKERGGSKGAPVYANFKDGISFEDGSGNWQLGFGGRIQADYRQFSPDADAADTFSIRRARLGATLTLYKDFLVRVEGDFGSSTSLTYGYVDFNRYKAAKLRAGQFKPNYGMERASSSNFLDFQERSLADSLLGSTYDRGVMVHGSPWGGVYYSLAYLNGSGTSDENNAREDGKDVTGRISADVAQLAGWKNAVVHLGGWYAKGDQGSRRLTGVIPSSSTEGRGVQFFSTTCATSSCGGTSATANAFGDNVDRTRGGTELALAYGPVKLQSEYIRTEFEGDGYDRDIDSWYASALWNVTGEPFAAMYKDGVFGRLKPSTNFGANGWGAVQLGLRYSKFDASDFKSTNTAGTGVLTNSPAGTSDGVLVATNEADAWTLGANWILTPNTRIVANYIHTKFDTPVTVRANGRNDSFDDEDALTLRAQFDF